MNNNISYKHLIASYELQHSSITNNNNSNNNNDDVGGGLGVGLSNDYRDN
mgnify:FL=1